MAFLLADGELFLLVIPSETDSGILAFFVIVIVAFVFVKGEGGISARINDDVQIVPFAFFGILHYGSQRQNATGTYKHRTLVEGGFDGYILSATIILFCPIVVPSATLRQILGSGLGLRKVYIGQRAFLGFFLVPSAICIFAHDFFFGVLRRNDRSGQDASSEEELIVHVPHALVVREVVYQRTQVAFVVVGYLPCGAI